MPIRSLWLLPLLLLVVSCNCNKPTSLCDTAKCAGCCDGDLCVTTSSQSDMRCGTHQLCAACSSGTSCVDGMCSAGGTGGGSASGGGTQSSGGGSEAAGGGDMSGGGSANTGGGSGGGSAATGGGTGGLGGGSGGCSMGPCWFDGGWQIPYAPPQPALVGDGGTTVEIGTGADSTSPGKFGGAAQGGGITLVYPPDGVMLPPNTNTIEFHFIPGTGQTLFHVHFHAPTQDFDVYTGCTALNGGCVYTPDQMFWAELVQYARGTAPVKYSITGVNGTTPGVVGTSPTQEILFSQQDLHGGLYYWNTAGTIERFDYGFPNVPVAVYANSATVGAVFCVGCHVMSRPGNRIVIGKDIPGPAQYSMLDVGTKTSLTTGAANFSSFSPDEAHLLQSNGNSIEWRDFGAGTTKSVVQLGTMPDWSPDGMSMVYAKPLTAPPAGFGNPGVDQAGLEQSSWNGAGFDPPTTLVPYNGQNNYYPAYSPDGHWVLFARSPANHNSFDNGSAPTTQVTPDGELWAIDSTGGTPVRLDTATNPGAISWPKWAPVKHDYYAGKVFWITFSSRRAYGLRLATDAESQLWMVAFDPARMAQGVDPTFAAFWLPFQDLGTGNHIGEWSVDVIRAPCMGTGHSTCSGNEYCINGRCTPG
jgi:hypothetical protein